MTMALVPRWVAGLHQVLVSPRGLVACRLSQSMVNAARSNPARARAWDELFIRTGVTRVTPKFILMPAINSAEA